MQMNARLRSRFLHKTLSLYTMIHDGKFVLKRYQPLPRNICQLWLDIQDIIGPVRKWPPKMRDLFFTKDLSHYQRLKICAFVYVNGLNPDMFWDWNEHFQLVSKPSALRECRSWFREFQVNIFKWQNLYQYNVYHNRYEYIDGRIKFYMPLGMLHPW